jgi:hypothetical protein
METQKRKQKPGEVKVLLRMDEALKADIQQLAKDNNRSLNSEIINAIKGKLKPFTINVTANELSNLVRDGI